MDANISITGMGIVCAIGNDTQSVLSSLKNGDTGIGKMKYLHSIHSDLPVGEVKLSNEQMKEMLGADLSAQISRTSLMGAIAIRQALEQSGLQNPTTCRIALISGTTVGGMDITENFFEDMKTDDRLLSLPQSNECGTSTKEMAELAGIPHAQTCTISTACSSALNSIILGSEMLKRDEIDVVIAGGAESLSRFHLNGFNTLMILDKDNCRPFDANRAGLNLGEGAAFVVMQKNASNPLAFVAGYGNRCDAFHQTASSENGEGAFLAMSDALTMSGLSREDIQYVNAHGTGTPNNDPSECEALKRVFGDKIPPFSSTKGYTGHTTSASGSIETVICILSMENNIIPANLGFNTCMENGISPSTGERDVFLNNIICNSFGFGGNDSSLIISRKPVHRADVNTSSYNWEIASDVTVESTEDISELKEHIPPMELRRMGKLMKASHLSAFRALKEASIESPDAIITATSRGMLEVSQQFLNDIHTNGEELLKPTLFMQSTHNTIGSSIAIRTRCHGYNTTYSHGDESFEWAMKDAIRLVKTGKAKSVLVGNYDESTATTDEFAVRSGKDKPKPLYANTLIVRRKN